MFADVATVSAVAVATNSYYSLGNGIAGYFWVEGFTGWYRIQRGLRPRE